MNRRNFVVGLGTVATISGVASVTAAQFSSGVTPTADFRIRPQDRDLTVEGSSSYDPSGDAQWTSTNLSNTTGDFANATTGSTADAVAYQDNSSVDGGLVTKLAFNNSNASSPTNYTVFDSTSGGDEFFRVINNGETDENVVFEFEYGDDVDGTDITEGEVADAFVFRINGTRVSPTEAEPNSPGNPAAINSGQTEAVDLTISIDDELYQDVQSQAGGAFSQTANSLQLLQAVNVDTA